MTMFFSRGNAGLSEAQLKDQKQELFKAAMNGQWNMVVMIFREEQVDKKNIIITRSGDSVLHVAISGAPQNIVLHLLDIIQKENYEEMHSILNLQNKSGDTPLHLAATLGLEKVCRRMANMYPEMVTSARNNLNETPLFSAVRYGKKNVFFVLEAAIHKNQNLKMNKDCLSSREITHCRRNDGNNILHYAIRGEQLDLAYEIILLYPQLANYFNSCREYALHTLADMPSVFESGTRFGFFDKIIYYYIEPLKFQFVDFMKNDKGKNEKPSDIYGKYKNDVLPPTCKACVDLFSLMTKDLISGIDDDDEENPSGAQKEDEYDQPSKYCKNTRRFPPNYDVTISFFKIIVQLLLFALGIVPSMWRGQTIAKLKQKHKNALQIMEKLVDLSKLWEDDDTRGTGEEPTESDSDNGLVGIRSSPLRIPHLIGGLEERSKHEGSVVTKACATESPVLVAAKRGITEMVEKILDKFPNAVLDQDKDKKNIVLLAVEHRQVYVYKLMLEIPTMKEEVFRTVDNKGNNVLHLAAMLSDSSPWSTGTALQVQWEIKWYKYVLRSMDWETLAPVNHEGKTPQHVFSESHQKLVKDGISWLTNTSQSCSTVATLFATVAFASVSTVPGGPDQSGFPILGERPAFQLFAISSLVTLCFSVTSVLMFLAILTSSFKVRDFERGLPLKLIVGLTSLFVTIASSLVSFCAGDLFVVTKNLKFAVYPIYAVMCFPVIFFAAAQLPIYINLIKVTIKKDPEPEVMLDY